MNKDTENRCFTFRSTGEISFKMHFNPYSDKKYTHAFHIQKNMLTVLKLVVKALGFDPEGSGPILAATKDLSSSCGVFARKILYSESPTVHR